MTAVSNLKLLSPTEAARRLRLSVRRVQKLCEEGRLGQMVGTQYVIPSDDVVKFARIPRNPGRPKKNDENAA